MSLRMPTALMNQLAVRTMLRQQVALSHTQQQVSTGLRVQTPADDPVASVQLQQLTRNQAQLTQFGRNSDVAKSRLQIEEQALADGGTLLTRVRELVLQANSATLTTDDRNYIATELKARAGELQAIANRRDGAGDFLFSGLSVATQPFARDQSGKVAYSGDSGNRGIAIDAAVTVQDGDSGDHLFMNVPAGNGLFTTAASATNTGSGQIDTGAITQQSSWLPDTYSVQFTAPGTWQVSDSIGTVLASGSYVDGGNIAFRGVQIAISGTPAAGDSFTVASAGTQSMFDSIDSIVATLTAGASNDAARARMHSALGGALQQIDQASNRLLDVRAHVGARLAQIDDADSARSASAADISTSISQVRDLDYASAISRMQLQYTGLQAAQQSYATVAKLSLFNYL